MRAVGTLTDWFQSQTQRAAIFIAKQTCKNTGCSWYFERRNMLLDNGLVEQSCHPHQSLVLHPKCSLENQWVQSDWPIVSNDCSQVWQHWWSYHYWQLRRLCCDLRRGPLPEAQNPQRTYSACFLHRLESRQAVLNIYWFERSVHRQSWHQTEELSDQHCVRPQRPDLKPALP